MEKSTKIGKSDVTFSNITKKGDMNYFWFNGFLTKDNEPYFSLGVNGRDVCVSGRYDQRFSIEDAKDIVKFLSSKIKEYDKTI